MRKQAYSILANKKSLSFSYVSFFYILIWGLSFFACKSNSSKQKKYEPTFSSDSSGKKVLTFGVPSLAFFETVDPMVRYLNENLGDVQVKTVACVSFDDYLNKLKNKYFDFTIANGLLALEVEKNGYSIKGKMGNDETYRGVIFVNRDSSINSFSDLKGKTISMASTPALAGTMMPLLYLYKNGVDVNKDITRLNVVSFESAILNVYLGKCAAGTSWITSWEIFIKRRPEIESKVVIKWETPPLVNNAILIRNDLEASVEDKLTSLMFTMQNNEQGKKALESFNINKFEKADSNTYKPIKDFLKEYTSVIH